MENLRKLLGIVWIALAITTIIFLLQSAAHNIKPNATKDINKPLPWIIIISVFIPIATGLALFGWYALKGEYNKAVNNSDE